MALTHADVLKIQTAIDAYEKKFPTQPSPSAEEALAWEANKRGASAGKNAKGQLLVPKNAKAVAGNFRLTAMRLFTALNVFKRPSPIS